MLSAAAKLGGPERGFIERHSALLGAATNSVPGAEIAGSDRPWPVVLFSPGGNVSRHFQTALAERIAGQGFVFVSMSHPHSTLDVAPESGFSMSIDWGLDQTDPEAALAADNRLARVLADDAGFVLDSLQLLAKQGHPLARALQLHRVGIAGHSRGGTTVGRACASDPRFTACAVLDNIGPEREQQTGVAPPFLTLRSPWSAERVAALHNYLDRTGSVAYDLQVADSNHFSCTDLPFFFADLRVEGVEPVDGINTCAGILVSFFDAYMRRGTATREAWKPAMDNMTIKRFVSGTADPF
jgi:pimeloyl-ACP methyl ester carboxylesterase